MVLREVASLWIESNAGEDAFPTLPAHVRGSSLVSQGGVQNYASQCAQYLVQFSTFYEELHTATMLCGSRLDPQGSRCTVHKRCVSRLTILCPVSTFIATHACQIETLRAFV
eukprot:3527972-Amphidinium_carterae.1